MWWGEDVHFSNLIKGAGFKLYGVADGETTHIGNFGWKGKLVDSFKRANGKDS